MNLAQSVPRFVIVGFVATLIHVSVAVGFIKDAQWHPSIANGIAFLAANLFSYAANTNWSFNSRISMNSWYRFIVVSLCAWLLTVSISWLVAEAGGSYLLGIFLVVIFIPPLSYLAHRNFTYRMTS